MTHLQMYIRMKHCIEFSMQKGREWEYRYMYMYKT